MRAGSNNTGLAGAKYRQIMAGPRDRVDQGPARLWPRLTAEPKGSSGIGA